MEEGIILNNILYRKFARENKNFLAVTVGNTGCLSKDTILYGQTKTLEELYKSGNIFIDTYSLTKMTNKYGTYYPIKSKSEIIPSGKKKVYEIELDNGKKVYVTSEHKFFKKYKNTFIECEVKDLNIGDGLRDFDINYIKNHYKNAKNRSYAFTTKKYNHWNVCKLCNNLIYIPRGRGNKTKRICTSCKEEIHLNNKGRHKNYWYGWEDNLLINFYYNKEKDFILNLMPHRTWSSILHRANRLKLKRKDELRWIHNAFKKGKDNIMNNLIIKEKAMNKQTPIFARNKMTSIERDIANFLDGLGIKYNFNKVIRTKSTFRFPDFMIGNLIIECDGIYWHKQRKNDKAREDELKELGFDIIRFTDNQINNNFEEVKKCILQKLNQ